MFGSEGAVALSPSRLLCTWIAGAVAGSIALTALYFPVWAALVFDAAITVIAIHIARRDALLISPKAVVALRFDLAGLHVQFRNGTWLEVKDGATLSSSFVNCWLSLVVVDCRTPWQRRTIVLLPDSLNPDVARRLRIWLWWSVRADADTKVAA